MKRYIVEVQVHSKNYEGTIKSLQKWEQEPTEVQVINYIHQQSTTLGNTKEKIDTSLTEVIEISELRERP